jgi:hypothetical protein
MWPQARVHGCSRVKTCRTASGASEFNFARHKKACSRAEPDNQTYGLHVWLCARDAAIHMDGIYGQFGIALPRHHACVSVTAHYQGPTTRILDCVWEHIVPALE